MSDKKQKRVLGRGLDALLGNSSDDENSLKPLGNINSFEIDINKIEVNPNQPRSNFDNTELDSLSNSIKDLGIIPRSFIEFERLSSSVLSKFDLG